MSFGGNLLEVFDELMGGSQVEEIEFGRNEKMLMDEYLRSVTQLYGKEMEERFRGLNVVDKRFLPVGIVTLF